MTAEEEESPRAIPPRVLTERDGHILRIGLNRPDKRNAADLRMLTELAAAYGELDRDPELRVGLVYAVGDHFTGGLDLADVGPRLAREPGQDSGPSLVFLPEGGVDPWAMSTPPVSKPVVVAVQGTCFTLGIELMLAADIAIAADSTKFGQIEVARAIMPFGGATLRFPRAVGWGNAMRWMLTADTLDAAEALRIGLVQEVVAHGTQLERAGQIASTIAAQAPLAVQATLANARIAIDDGDEAAKAALPRALAKLAASEDAQIGAQAFANRTTASYIGR